MTVDWLPYPALAGAKKILLAMNVPTDAVGNFMVKIVFPTTIMGIYNVTAVDAKGLKMSSTFEVIPGIILTPDPVVGSALIKVIATGLPANITMGRFDLLVNELDAMVPLADQLERWCSDANGTLKSGP
ncbi:MAG: hypothetical protein QXM76_04410, partial [Zestosphaera sp.]